jgi:hypothetical protein
MTKDPKKPEYIPPEITTAEPGTAIVSWRDKMALVAAQAAQSEAPKGGFLSFKGGRMSYNDEQIPGDKMNVIIIDFLLENAWYKEKFNPNKLAVPACYALGRNEEEMVPHEECEEPQNPQCGIPGQEGCCPFNEWASDPDGGRGKACKNSRRIAVIPADTLLHGSDAIRKVTPVMCKLPVTSLKNFSAHINKIVKVLGTAPMGVISELSVHPHPANQFEVVWKIMDQIANDELLSALMAKHEQIKGLMWSPYPKLEDEVPATKSNKY